MNRRMVALLVLVIGVLFFVTSLTFKILTLEATFLLSTGLLLFAVLIKANPYQTKFLVGLVLMSGLLTGCVVHAPLPGDGRRVTFVAPSLGGKSVVIINHVRDSKMQCEIIGIGGYNSDVSHKTEAVMGDSVRFFLSHQALRDRREANVLCQFFSTVEKDEKGNGVYMGVRNLRFSLSNRGGQFESEVEEISRLDQPNRVRLRD